MTINFNTASKARRGSVVLWLLLACASHDVTMAQVAQPEGPKRRPGKGAIDEQLLDDLLPTKPQDKPASTAAPNRSAAGEDIGQTSEARSLGAEIARDMRQVEALLREQDTSTRTRRLQHRIATDLARMIEQQEQQQQGKPSASKQRTKSKDSSSQDNQNATAGNTAGSGSNSGNKSATNSGAATDLTREMWGVLPDRVQEQIRIVGQEEFLPKFEDIIQQYYEKLSERSSTKP